MKKNKIISIFFLIIFLLPKESLSENINLQNQIFKNLRCLICQGQSIYDSHSDFAESMKLVVKDKLASGMNEDDIYLFLKIQYGEWILYEPQFDLKNSLLWLLPILIFISGGALILIKFGVLKKR